MLQAPVTYRSVVCSTAKKVSFAEEATNLQGLEQVLGYVEA